MILSRWLAGLTGRTQVARTCGSIRRRRLGRSLSRGSGATSSLVSAFGGSATGELIERVERLEDRTLLVSNFVNLSVSANSGTEADGTVITVTATADTAVSGDQTVNLAVTGTGITAGDYSLSSTQITIPDGMTTGTVTFTIQDDALLEATETATLTISTPSAGIDLGTILTQDVSITDNDTATANLSVTTQGNEAGPINIVYTVTLTKTNNTGSAITFDLDDLGTGSAASGSDYTAIADNAQISVANGASTGTLTVLVTDDSLLEATETVIAQISNSSNTAVTIGTASATANITDNDTATANLSVTTQGNEAGPVNIVYTVTLTKTNNTGSAITFDLDDLGTGSASSGSDYTAIANNAQISVANGTSTGTLTVLVTDDSLLEATETVIAQISNSSNTAVTIGTASATANITDNDTATANLSVTTQGNEAGPINIVYTVTLTKTNNTGSAITFDLDDLGTGSASSGLDYTAIASNAQISVANGASTGTLTVVVTDDSLLEATETVIAQISNSSFAAVTIGTASATANITENDSATISIAPTRTVTEIGGAQTIVVTLTTSDGGTGTATLAPGVTLTANVVVATIPGSATEGTDYSAFGTQMVTFNPGDMNGTMKTVTITVTDDSDNEDSSNVNETVNLTLQDLNTLLNGRASLDTTSCVVTIDDHPFADIVDITPDPLDRANAGIVTINFKEAVTGVDISDFTLTLTTVAAGTVNVSLTGLSVTEVSSTQYTINLSSVTTAEGVYDLVLNSGTDSDIKDSALQLLVVDATDNWVLPPAVATLAPNGSVTINDTGTPTDNQLGSVVETPATGPFAGQAVLVITDPNGLAIGASANTFQRNNTTIEILLSAITGGFTFSGGAGNDTLTVDLSQGTLPFNITFLGGSGTDSLVVENFSDSGDFNSYTANYSNRNDGSILFRNGTAVLSTLTYFGLEPITIDGTPTEIIFNLPSTNDTDVRLLDIGGTNSIMRLTGSTFETTDFSIAAAMSITINANAGNDRVTIQSIDTNYTGVVIINGGSGDDVISASNSRVSTILRGDAGNDTITGSGQNDTLSGGAGRDSLNGGAGTTDTVVETTADMVMTLTNTQLTGNGTDQLTKIERAVLTGSAVSNILDASVFTLGNVTLLGGAGDDTLIGGAGDDSLDGGAGNDVARQSSRNNQLLMLGTTPGTHVVTGAGSDLWVLIEGLHFIGSGTIGRTLNASLFTGDVTLSGGSGGDVLVGGSRNNFLSGNDGNDVLTGGNGTDTLNGGAGNDELIGLDGNDLLKGQSGNDTLRGGIGDDRMFGEEGRDILYGGSGQDLMDGGEGNDVLTGENGHDTINGGAGNDAISGGSGDDILSGDSGNDTILGGSGADVLRSGGGADYLSGEAGNDRFFASGARIILGGGDDSVSGSGNRIDAFFIFDFEKLLV